MASCLFLLQSEASMLSPGSVCVEGSTLKQITRKGTLGKVDDPALPPLPLPSKGAKARAQEVTPRTQKVGESSDFGCLRN